MNQSPPFRRANAAGLADAAARQARSSRAQVLGSALITSTAGLSSRL